MRSTLTQKRTSAAFSMTSAIEQWLLSQRTYWRIVIDELLENGNVLCAKNGNGKLKLYATVTCTTQFGLFAPSCVSQAPPVEVVPGHDVDTVRLDDERPGGSMLTT
jgi:hypothetical protein